ncbi:MAG TPA: hypothetical protein PKV13_00810 [Propionicimonas sp.]|mgnify:FL=1|nr:hypothetical protein [Propionicimonas sp.]HRA05144.1 hypothetical protein [Propionicimonas sp.]
MTLRDLASESAVHGVVLISGLLVIVANQADAASQDALVKVLATTVVFWLAHVYAGAVSHLGDHHEEDYPSGVRLRRAVRYSLDHSWGMLGAALVPAVILSLGAIGLLTHENAIWTTLWVDVAILAVLGYLGVATWTPRLWARLAGAMATALLGVVLILLKALIH